LNNKLLAYIHVILAMFLYFDALICMDAVFCLRGKNALRGTDIATAPHKKAYSNMLFCRVRLRDLFRAVHLRSANSQYGPI
jgi:hypothetical protein